MASLSHNLYDMPGPAPRMDVLFWGKHEFKISFSNRDTYFEERLKSSLKNCYGRYGDLIKQYEVMLNDIL